MPTKFLYIFLLFVNWASYAKVFSQISIIPQADENHIEITKKLANAYFHEKKTFSITDEADFINYLHTNNINDSTLVLFGLGNINFQSKNYLRATRHFLVANEALRRNENAKLNAEVLFATANSYQRLFFLKKAIDYYHIALNDFIDYIPLERQHRIIMDIGNSYYDLYEYDSAQYYYYKALKQSKEENDSLHQTVALINIGNLNMFQQNYADADSITKKALALSKIYKLEHLEVMCKFNLGELHFFTKDFETTKNLFRQVLNDAEKVSFERLIPSVYKYFVLIAFDERNYNDVVRYSNNFYKESDKFVVQEKKIKSIKQINKVLDKVRFVEGADECFEKNIQMLDSILFKEIKEKQYLMESLQQLTELQGEYKDLINQNRLNEEKLTRFKLVTGLVIVILVLAGLFVTIITRSRNKIRKQHKTIQKQFEEIKKKNRETEELNHEVNMQTEEIRMQNEQLLANQQELENRIKERTYDLESALKKAEESDELKTSFLQNLSHEIRTPLNAINGFAQLINKDSNVKTDYAKIISQNVFDLIDIIDNIVLFSTLQAGQYITSVSTTPIVNIVNQLQGDFSLIKNKYQRKSINFEIETQVDDTITLKTDVSLLQKMLVQLVENAFKFTEIGTVTLKIERVEENLRFSVTDTGIGIKKEKQPYIFDTFRKLETEKVFRGTGIGLALVKKISELLSGKISLISEFGKGTTIQVEFPVNQHK